MTARGAWPDGDYLRATRTARKLTQGQLALLANLDVKTVRKAEKGQRLDLTTLRRLALVIQADLDRLVRPEHDLEERDRRQHAMLRHWQSAISQQNWTAALALYHDQAVLHLPGEPLLIQQGTFAGKTAVRHAYDTARHLIAPGLERRPRTTWLVSDGVAYCHTRRELTSANHERLWLPVTHRCALVDDLIMEHVIQFDTLRFAWSQRLIPTRSSRPRGRPGT